MKRIVLLSLSFVLLAAAPVFAAETLSLYDNFNSSTLINNTKWTGYAYDVLETYKYLVKVSTDPAPVDRELLLAARGYGYRTSSAASQGRGVANGLRFRRADPNVVRAIKATVKVNSAQAVGCPTAGSEVTQARLRILGYFFNDGTGEPGRATGDVQGRIDFRRLSNSTVSGEINVRAAVYRCLDSNCVYIDSLFNQTLGTIMIGNTATVLLQWDPATNRFLFQLNALPVVSYTYSLPDTAPPQNFWDKKTIEISHWIGNCVAAQTQAYMSVNLDDVSVNSAATLTTAAATAPATKALAETAPIVELMPGPEPSIPEPDDMGWATEPEPDFPKPGK